MAKEEINIPIGDGTLSCTNELKFWPVTLKGSANLKVVFIDTVGIGSFLEEKDEIAFIHQMRDDIGRIKNI